MPRAKLTNTKKCFDDFIWVLLGYVSEMVCDDFSLNFRFNDGKVASYSFAPHTSLVPFSSKGSPRKYSKTWIIHHEPTGITRWSCETNHECNVLTEWVFCQKIKSTWFNDACGQEKVFLQTIYLDEFLKTLPPKRPFPCGIFFSSFKNVSKIKPKSAIFAYFLFFSLFALPYFSFPFPPLVWFTGLSNAKTPVFWPFSIQKAAHLARSLF